MKEAWAGNLLFEDDPAADAKYRLERRAERSALMLYKNGEIVSHTGQYALLVLERLALATLQPDGQNFVSKADLYHDVWGSRQKVSPQKKMVSVERAISTLRSEDVLNDDEQVPRIIETATPPLAGYRFLPKVQRQIDPDSDQISQAFEEVFGEGASTHMHDGVIVLRSDPIDKVLAEFIPDLNQKIKAMPGHRLYKARTWINRWDTEAARAIREEFQKQRMKAPELLLTESNSPDELHFAGPFEIVMGLFTAKSRKAIQSCLPWLRIHIWQDSGDGVSLHERLGPEKAPRFLAQSADLAVRLGDRGEVLPPAKGFRRLLPSDWHPDHYLDSWLTMLTDANVQDVHDYAIIFRNTILKPNHHRQVIFVLAGYSERGTAIAGRYLAENWQELWKRHVKGRATTDSLGDFLVLIEGFSRPESFADWTEDETFEVTPKKLCEKGIECEWSNRVKPKHA
jgi:DNA-binding winged helix-turn-helix (wHTH) protein